MGLEVATYISELVATNPVGAVDDYATADDHLRLIKAVLQAQFPNFTAVALGASQAELDTLDGYTGNTADLNVLSGAAAGGLTAAELLFVADVTSAIQAQLDAKAASSHTHDTVDIIDDAITYAKMQNVAADNRVLGNVAGVGGIVAELTKTQLLTLLNAEDGATADQTAGEIEAIVSHDNLQAIPADDHVAHSGVDVVAGTGMTGGGAIDASRTLNVIGGIGITANAGDVELDITGLTAIEANAIIAADGYLVDNGGVMNRMAHSDGGIPVQTVTGTADTLATADMNTYIEYTNAAAVTVTLNTGVGKKSNVVVIEQAGAGQVTVAGTATVNAANGKKTALQRSVIVLQCTATNVWTLFGDAVA